MAMKMSFSLLLLFAPSIEAHALLRGDKTAFIMVMLPNSAVPFFINNLRFIFSISLVIIYHPLFSDTR